MFTLVIVAVLALGAGAAIALAISHKTVSALKVELAANAAELSAQTSALAAREAELAALRIDLQHLREAKGLLEAQVATLAERLAQEQKQADAKVALLQDAGDRLSNQFKALANDILEEKTKRFTEQNQTNLSHLLGPLSQRIQEFQQKVDLVYVQEGKDRSALAEQVKQLMGLNQRLSEDANKLTRALKTSSKTQGDLGELILNDILEASGLRKDHEYKTQESFRSEEGRNVRPDVVIYLPEGKNLIIDSKVSLSAYHDYVNAESDETRNEALARHLASVSKHVRELSGKSYQSLYQLESIDFVCMFVPIEGAFLLALSEDGNLWRDAYERNVLLVSSSTLLFVVRTVAHLWQQERQKLNVTDIVKRGAELYDKFVGFVEDLKQVGDRLEQARKSYDSAYGKLASGKGNVIRQAEMLKQLGVQSKKNLPSELVDASSEEMLLPEKADAAHSS